jgi:16S rRNA (cytosine967-C5)-methyltransferase
VAAIAPARHAAFRILLVVERGGGHSDELLRAPFVSALSLPDRNLATALVLGVLRWQIQLDRRIRPLLKRPNARLDPEILIALRLGAFQLFHLDRIPAHAAIDESVELAKRSGHRFAAAMVNAVLRKIASSNSPGSASASYASTALGQGMNPNGPNPNARSVSGHDLSRAEQAPKQCGALAPATAAYPAWMLERWTRIYGVETTCALCAYGQQQPQLSIRLADPAAEAELKAEGIELAPGHLLTAARTVLAGDVTATAALREGRIRIQDEGSQLVAEIAAAAPVQRQGKILDACAAPGGKTLILAERHPAAHLVACESSPQRLALLTQRLSPFASHIHCRLADAAALGDDSVFDLALADVPCSGTGTLGRNPEIRHRLAAADLPRQAHRQQAILRAALRAVRPGGFVVYSTCSLEPEENEQVVAEVLEQCSQARQLSLAPRIEQLLRAGILTQEGADHLAGALTLEGALRLIPGKLPSDGFFIALLERIA